MSRPDHSTAEATPPFWDAGYARAGVSTMGGPNHDIVEIATALPSRARVLDLGCGEGRNAFYLGGLGHRVTAMDLSPAGVAKLARLSDDAGLQIIAEVGDLNTYEVTGEWDLVMAHGVIDYLANEKWRALCASIREHTVPGGYNAYTCMLFSAEFPEPPEFRRAGFKHSLAPGELVGTYAGWQLARHDRYVKWDQHPGIPIHCHPVDKLVARKPDGAVEPFIRTPVPTGSQTLDRALFDTIPMGFDAAELPVRCGAPAVVDRYPMPGRQFGVAADGVVDGYDLELWFYGRAVMYVVNGRVWGRALYESEPVRVSYRGPGPVG